MGIRIKKAVCYGLTDYNPDLTDRFNSFYQYDNDFEKNIGNKGAVFLQEKMQEFGLGVDESKRSDYHENHMLAYIAARERTPEKYKNDGKQDKFVLGDHMLSFDEEDGLENVIGFIPSGLYEQWMQRDNDIDYYTNALKHGIDNQMVSTAEEIPMSLYPFLGVRNLRTGKDFKHGGMMMQRARAEDLDFQNEHGCESAEEVLSIMGPTVPRDILAMMILSGAFVDPHAEFLKVKPLLLTWWS